MPSGKISELRNKPIDTFSVRKAMIKAFGTEHGTETRRSGRVALVCAVRHNRVKKDTYF
jgi:hypothetical protein